MLCLFQNQTAESARFGGNSDSFRADNCGRSEVRKSGKRDAANIIRTVASSSPSTITTIKESLKESGKRESRPLSSEEALAYYIDSKSTSYSYKQTRQYAFRTGNKVFPSYYSLQKAKKDCYPSEDYIVLTETTAEISLKAILDKTTERLVRACEEVLLQANLSMFTLVSKWGGDGSSGHRMGRRHTAAAK